MWNYNYSDELYHYGVPGMKWGVRKKTYDAAVAKRKAWKQANKEYDKSFNKAYNKAIAAYSPVKKHRQANDARWEDAWTKGRAADKAKKEYKQARQAIKDERKERRKKINTAYDKVTDNTTMREKFIYNDATRKKAAKYMVDHNMSMADAKEKANADARRNTMVILGVCGAYTVGQLMLKK